MIYPSTPEQQPLFVFIDESGNLDFGPRGTEHFVMAAYITPSPAECSRGVVDLKYEYMREGLIDQLPFHAVNNSRGTRKRFVAALCENANGCSVRAVHCLKAVVPEALRSPGAFYNMVASALAEQVITGVAGGNQPVVFMFDSALPSRLQRACLKALKPQLSKLGIEYQVSFAPVKQEPCGQIADYYAWALYRALTSGDTEMLGTLPQVIVSTNLCRDKNDHPA